MNKYYLHVFYNPFTGKSLPTVCAEQDFRTMSDRPGNLLSCEIEKVLHYQNLKFARLQLFYLNLSLNQNKNNL